jgi:hypothetical protein
VDWQEYGWNGVYSLVSLSGSEGSCRHNSRSFAATQSICMEPIYYSYVMNYLEQLVGINAGLASYTQKLTPPGFIYSTELEKRIFQSTSPNVAHLRAVS